METRKNDWRLERWIAILLSLLYLLPFVARAQELPSGEQVAGLYLLTPDSGEWTSAVTLSSEWTVTVTGSIARATLRQTFRNESSGSVEGIYVLPLPETAPVDTLRVRVGDRQIDGGRGAARRQGRISIASILPGEEVVVEAEWEQPVIFDTSGGILRIPTVVATSLRPVTSSGPSLPEESPLPAMFISENEVSPSGRVEILLLPGAPITSIVSPTHSWITTEAEGPYRWRIVSDVDASQRQFVLRWTFASDEPPAV